MKVFNKDKALRQIKLKQNKNTYIKKVSIVLSCFILIIVIIMFTFAKFEQNSEEYTLINGVVKYGGSGDIQLSYVVDGVSQSAPPAKGTGYKIKNINCTNGTGTWSNSRWSIEVSNITGKVKCNLEFEQLMEITTTLYSAAEDEVYYMDGDERVVLGTTDLTGKLENAVIPAVDSITLYSSVAKNPSDLSNYYSKSYLFDGSEDEVYLMPDKTFYWYGWCNGNHSTTLFYWGNFGTEFTYETNRIKTNESTPNINATIAYTTYFETPIDVTDANFFKIVVGDSSLQLYSTDISSRTGNMYAAIGIGGGGGGSSWGNTVLKVNPDTETIIYNKGGVEVFSAQTSRNAYHYALWLE